MQSTVTIKIAAISFIAENCMDGLIWPKYNLWINNYPKDKTDAPTLERKLYLQVI